MADPTDRPIPRSNAIDPMERTEILRELLAVERARLSNALAMEKSRHIVFPETTVIVKDVERLIAALGGTEERDSPTGTDAEELLRSLREET